MKIHRLKKWLAIVSDPFTRCLLIGAFIFCLSWIFDRSGLLSPVENIHIGQDQIQQIASRYHLLAGRYPSELELKRLVDDYIDEEIAYRQALSMGLDKDDTVIRRRLRQKVMFLTEDLSVDSNPDKATLLDWYEQHPEEFEVPEMRTFTQLLFRAAVEKDNNNSRAETALQMLNANLDQQVDSDQTMLPATMQRASLADIEKVFGSQLSQAVFQAPQNTWSGPIASPYGLHLLQIENIQQAYLPPFEQIWENVLIDWQQTQQFEKQQAYLQALRAQYRITVDPVTVKPVTVAGAGS